MVRLKGRVVIVNIEKIKKISIPYGAIKRAVPTQVYGIKGLFQFLMVRLKDSSLP